jgi:hypothetical protein
VSAKQQTFIEALARDNFPLPDDVRANWLGAKIPKSPTLNNVEQIFGQLEAPSLYPQVYRFLSTTVHPSEYTLTHYATIEDGAPRSFNKRRTRQDYESVLWVAAFSALLAVTAYADLHRGKPYKARIQRIADSSPTPMPLWLTDDGKAPKNRRYGSMDPNPDEESRSASQQ